MKLVIIIVIATILFFLLLTRSKETFDDINMELLFNILPCVTGNLCGENDVKDTHAPLYIATILPSNNKPNDNIVYTRSLLSKKWYGPIPNSIPDNDTIMVDLTFNKDKILMGVGLKMVDGVKVYTLYKKKTIDICSEWVKIPESNDLYSKKIMSLLHDDDDGLLLGINEEDGQIYKKKTENIQSEWIGPINYDIPMRKIMYYKDGVMIGISRDNHLYKKKGVDWKTSKWDRQFYNKTMVHDVFFDHDGALIATSHKGLLKQKNATFLSRFFNINDISDRHLPRLLNDAECLKFKTGLNLHDDFNLDLGESRLAKKYEKILHFKKNMINMCENRSSLYKQMQTDNDNIMNEIKTQNSLIDNIKSKLTNYGEKYEI